MARRPWRVLEPARSKSCLDGRSSSILVFVHAPIAKHERGKVEPNIDRSIDASKRARSPSRVDEPARLSSASLSSANHISSIYNSPNTPKVPGRARTLTTAPAHARARPRFTERRDRARRQRFLTVCNTRDRFIRRCDDRARGKRRGVEFTATKPSVVARLRRARRDRARCRVNFVKGRSSGRVTMRYAKLGVRGSRYGGARRRRDS